MMVTRTILVLLLLSFAGCSKDSKPNQNASAPQNDKAALEARDTDGNTPLLRAVNSGDNFEVRRLVDAGADINAATNSGVTPLMNAGGMGNKEAVELLIAKGANVNHRTPGNYTPLMQAALTGQIEIVKVLLDAGADPAVKDTGGRTAADYAEEHKHNDIVQLLKERLRPAARK
ncbi:MAG TPA: ankyrin repeat domain-containing protein [Blastocatellia bacterium]|nr:ankyrin repeat domain-containing protein [Blastocatellia bacterium]